ncbi:MAG: DUF2341 domain-containing protein [bacterium]
MVNGNNEARGKVKRFALVAATAGLASGLWAASVINVNVTGGANATLNGYFSSDASASGSATRVAPAAYVGSTWNEYQNPGTATGLLDSVGGATGVGFEWGLIFNGGPWADWNGLGGARMLVSGKIGANTNYTPALTLTGLNSSHTYDLYIASLHNTANRAVDFQIGPAVLHVQSAGATDWTSGQNYVRFTNLVSAADGTIVVNAKTPAGLDYAPMNGFQLVDNSAPTPNSPAKDILTFDFGALGPASIAGTNISLSVLWGTAVTNLSPTYTLAPLASALPLSGGTNNFAAPVTYTVTAQDGSTKAYRVTVAVLPKSSAKDILSCSFGALGTAVISGTNISIAVPVSQPLTNLAPTFTYSPFATLSPASGSTNNFTAPVTYTVTAQDGSTKAYKVTVLTYEAWTHSASLYILTTPAGANLPAGASETNFPLLVRLNAGNFDFSQAKPLGEDIRFSTGAGVPLPYQIEQWDSVGGTASIWVKIPVITGNTTQEIKMYWGRADAAGESSGAAVFNAANGFVSVIHLNETLQDEAGAVTPVDVGTSLAAGMIGKGRHIDMGTGVNCGDHITNYPYASNPFTYECWFRPEQGGITILYYGRYATRYNGNTGDGNEVGIQVGAPVSLYWGSDGPGGATAATVPTLGQWYHIAAAYSNGISKIFVNGQLDGSHTGGSTAMSVVQDIQMKIGGFRGSFNYAGDIDEVRVSRVARSTNWMWLAYQNQNPLQTLVGPPVQTGSVFSVSTTNVTMNEGSVTNLTGRAGGAQKIYWLYKKNGQETVLAVDQYTLSFVPGRVTGDQSFTLQFKAVYPAETKTADIDVTVTDSIPDPVYTLTPSLNPWDGRQTMTVTPSISNWGALQAQGATNLTYIWSVAGVAVAKQVTPGTLTLTRAQGSGPMTVTLVLDNGGSQSTQTVTVNVQEPASDAWVHRTPDANEKPVDGQFYARDDTGSGTICYNGTLSQAGTNVYLKVYTNGPSGDVLVTHVSQTLPGNKVYALSAKIAAGLVKYKVEFGYVNAGSPMLVATVTNLVCGDAYIIDGQSNAVADNNDPPYGAYTSEWIRSFGTMGGGNAGGWCNAVASSAGGKPGRIGYWGIVLASNLVSSCHIPICIINDSVGGTRIDQHQANPADHYSAGSSYSIYASILTRVAAAKLTHGIRGVLWHQGENNSGAAAPTGDWDYKSYQQYFVEMSAAWKQDYPNLQHYYVYQVWPLPCGMGPKGDQLREAQRTLPRLYSNLSVMSSVGVTESWPSTRGLCHFDGAGYVQLANLMAPLVKRDNYGLSPSADITAPELKRAYFTTTNRNEIALEFGQQMDWFDSSKKLFYLDGASDKVAGGATDGKTIRLQLTVASTNQTITYLADSTWDGTSADLLLGTNDIAALTFADVPIASSGGSNSVPVIAGGTSTNVVMSEDGSPAPFSLTLNATDADGDTLTWSVSAPAAHGTATAGGTGTSKAISYTPNAQYNGSDSFTVQVSDGHGGTDTLAVSVTVQPVNDAPGAIAQSVSTPVNTAKAITLSGSDVDAGTTLTYAIVTGPSPGTLSGTPPAVTYTPAANYNGPDMFTFKVNDGTVDSDPATVSVSVSAVNDAPVANAGADQTVRLAGGAATASVTLSGAGSTDGDGMIVSYLWTESAVQLAAGSAVSVALAAGVHTIILTVQDNGGATASDTVVVTVTPAGAVLAEDFEHEWADNALANTTNGWTSSGSADLSSVTNPPAGYAALAGGVPFPLAYDHAGQKRMLKLNTQGDTLTTPGTDEGFANDKVYVDMMVNFTVGETLPAAPSADADVKAAVYLKAEGASTNLYVFHGQKVADGFGEPVFSVATNGAAIVPGTWYRLTVVLESLDAASDAEAFRVYINGQALLSSVAYSDNWKQVVFTSPYTPDGGSWFLSAARRTGSAGSTPSSIGNLAFQGTGLIDDLVVTSKEPSFVYGTVFMLTLSDGHWQGGGRRW